MAPVPSILERVGRRVAELRHERGLSQEDLAHRAGLSRTYVGAIETGAKQPTLRTLSLLADKLDVFVAEFFLPTHTTGSASKEVLARIKARLMTPRLTAADLRKIEELIDAFLR